MKKTKKLMWKIFAYLIGFCAILLSVLWIMETVLLEKMYENIRKNEIKTAIVLVEENIDSPGLDRIILRLQEEYEILVTPAYSFIPPMIPGPNDRPRAITESRDFVTADGDVLTFVFHAIISPVNATIATIKVQLYYVTGIMLFLSVILAFIIAKTVAKPIEKLNNGAKLLADGDYDIHFSGEGYREIHELSDTLNYTAAELSKVEELRRELMANISHDLRTPLALIYSYAEMMHDFPDEITADQIQVIMNETTRLSSLVSDILDLSQLETGIIELDMKKYNLTESIALTIARISELVKARNFEIKFERDELVYLFADEGKVTQAFYNLLVNAVHYSGDSSKIVVRQIVKDNQIRIEVEDFGLGIEAENIPYIWDRYYKTDEAHRRALVGTGLGLSIVKKIVEIHGGKYGVESEFGKGSTFWFSLEIT